MAVIDELKLTNIFHYDENGFIKVVPLSQYEYRTHPIDDENDQWLPITEDDYIGLKLMVYQFNPDLHQIEPFDREQFNAFLRNRGM